MVEEVRLARRRALLLPLLIFVVILVAALLFLRENFPLMVQALGGANYGFVFLALFVYLLGLAFWAGRWHVTLSTVGYPVPTRSLYVVIFGGIFINNITPFTYAGGDPIARTYILRKTHDVPYSSGFSTILAEFILDIPLYFTLLMLGTLLAAQVLAIWYAPLVVGIWLAVMVIWVLIFTRMLSRTTASGRLAGFVARVGKIFRRRIDKAKLEESVRKFYSGSSLIIKNRKVVVFVIAITAALWILGMARLFLILHALDHPPPLHMLLFAVTLPAIVGMVPLLPGGLGTVDMTITSVLYVFGAPLEIAMSATLIERAITLVFSTFVGAGALSYLGIKVWARSEEEKSTSGK